MRTTLPTTAGVALAFLLAASAQAQRTETFFDDLFADFVQGDVTEVVLTHDGFLHPPLFRERLAELEESVVWDILLHEDALIIATGHEGKLLRKEMGAAPELLIAFPEAALYALAVAADGRIVVGASPGGILYKLDENFRPEIFAQVGHELIWDIVADGDRLLVATGPNGAIMAVDADGTVTEHVVIERVSNVLDLQLLEDGSLAFATQGTGLFGKVDPEGVVRIHLDPEQEEVRRVALLPDGSLLGAVNGIRSPGERLLVPAAEAPRVPGNQQPQPASFLARVHPNGFVEEWWTSPETPIHDIHVDKNGQVIVAAGSRGNLYRVVGPGRADRVGIAREEFLTRLAPGENGEVFIGTGSAAALYRLNPEERMAGSFESRVFDARGSARWGRLSTIGSSGDGSMTIQYRTGNTARPDPSWAEWSELADLSSKTATVAPDTISRFFQYRVEINLPKAPRGENPMLDAVRVFYSRPNVAPRISTVTAAPTGERREGQPRRTIEITASASDPNSDPLRYTFFLEPLNSDRSFVLAENVSDNKHSFDSSTLPDGAYRARVRVSDHVGNPMGGELTAEAVSAVFIIDNTQPEIEIVSVDRRDESTVTIRFVARDAASTITRASWRLGAEPARPLLPLDGFFDQQEESFELRLENHEEATVGSILTLLVADENENVRTERVILD